MKRKLAFVLALIAVCAVVAVFLLAPRPAAPARQKIHLPDGNIVTLEKVTFSIGTQHDFSFDDSTLTRFRRNLPRFLRRYFPPPGKMSWNTTSNSLVLWFTMADGKTGAPLDFHSLVATEIVDEHGCSSGNLTYGSMRSGTNPSIYVATFSQFPRRQEQVRVRLRERPKPVALPTGRELNKVLAEFELPNPTRGPFPVWRPEPLPAVRTNADLVFILREAGNPRPDQVWNGPRIDILRGGRPAWDWERDELYVAEATGNRGQQPYCTNEPAWKFGFRFLRNVKASFLPTEMFTVTNLVLPGPGAAVPLTNAFSLEGRQFEMRALAGPGHYVYSNTVVTLAEPMLAGQSESSTYQRATPNYQFDVRRKEPHVVLMLPTLEGEERFMLRARFRNGAVHKLVPGPKSARLSLFTFYGVTNAGPFDLDVIVQRVRAVEFFVKPPGPIANSQ
jgi:hypothetical protein